MCFLGIIVGDVEEFKQQKAEAEKSSKIRRAWREIKERLEELRYEARDSAFMNPILGWLLPVPEEWRCKSSGFKLAEIGANASRD